MLQYRIRDSKVLSQRVLPIFETYRLHTTKYYSYTIWKSALLDKINREVLLLQRDIPDNKSPPHKTAPTKHWIIGFVEAEDSFYIVKKDINRCVHAFAITQKKEVHILEQIRDIFHIKLKPK
jgi:hypothetical protein